jgi:hypothetical protein
MILVLHQDLAIRQEFYLHPLFEFLRHLKMHLRNNIYWDMNLNFSFANRKISKASSCLSSSQMESPIFPPKAFTKVKVIPPP